MLQNELRLECLKMAVDRGGSASEIIETANDFFDFVEAVPSSRRQLDSIQHKDQESPSGSAPASSSLDR